MRPERFTAWILATALCAAAPAVQGAPDAATRTSAATALSLQDARTRLLQVSDQLAAARAAVESKRLQTQGLQGLGGPIVGLSASHTRYSLHGELDLAEAKQEIGNRLSELGPLLPALGPLAQPVGQLATRLPQAIPDALPYHLKGTRNSQAISAVWPVYTGGATQAVKDFSAAQQDEAQDHIGQLADRADSHNSAAYADLSEQDLPEDKFRAGLLEILGGKAEETPVPRVVYIAWNGARTQGFATTEYQLAYEARKGSDSNCFDQDGNRSDLAVTFCDVTGDEDCTIETIHQDLPAESVLEEVR